MYFRVGCTLVLLIVAGWSRCQYSQTFPVKWMSKVYHSPNEANNFLSEVWHLFQAPGNDPIAMAAAWRAQLQPIKPRSAIAYNMAYITMLAHEIGNSKRQKGEPQISIQPYLDTMLQVGLSSTDLWQQAHATWAYGAHIRSYNRIDEAATFYLLGIELYEKLPFFERMYAKYGALAEVLFHTGDYDSCIAYGRRAIVGEGWITTHYDYHTMIRYYNTMGQAFYQVGQPDSALHYFDRSKRLAIQKGNQQWVAINASFEGQVYAKKGEWNKAYALFKEGYVGNLGKDPPMESFSLAGMGKAYMHWAKLETARNCFRQALQMAAQSPGTQRWQVAHYRKEILQSLAEICRLQNQPDSFYHYSYAALQLEDSMLKVASQSNIRIAKARSQVEQYRLQAASLSEKERHNRVIRNIIIGGIVLIATVIILLLGRRNRILLLQQQMAIVKQKAHQAEIAEAREKLSQIASNLLEKNQLLAQLKQSSLNSHSFKMQMMEWLSTQVILTDEDWEAFRSTFEKIYPGFFTRLRQTAPDITMAEQRMAALSLLQMNGKEMGAMLGISPDSVRKTRQRLRQRMQVAGEDELMLLLNSLTTTSV